MKALDKTTDGSGKIISNETNESVLSNEEVSEISRGIGFGLLLGIVIGLLLIWLK